MFDVFTIIAFELLKRFLIVFIGGDLLSYLCPHGSHCWNFILLFIELFLKDVLLLLLHNKSFIIRACIEYECILIDFTFGLLKGSRHYNRFKKRVNISKM